VRICDEKAQIYLLLAAIVALKFRFGDLLLFGLLFKILIAPLGEFSVHFVVSKLLILAYFLGKNLTNFLIKICWHFKMCKKIREFPEFLKFIF